MSKRQLKNITLLSFNGVNPTESVKALLYSSKKIEFAEMVLVSNQKPDRLPSSIRYVPTKLGTVKDYNLFSYLELPDLIETDYALMIHDDGFIINPHLWDDHFLDYDYIGAPWRYEGQRNRVGNGGFCLRSKKFVKLTKNLRYLGKHEDGELTNDYYDYFVGCGCRYAPLDVAMRFSLESRIPECEYNLNNCFGFHGKGVVESVHFGGGQQFKDRIRLLDEIVLD